METAPLLAVALLFRHKTGLDGIDHIVETVSAFVDTSVELPLAKACAFGSVKLLERVWNSSVDLRTDGRGLWSVRRLLRTYRLYGKLQFSLGLVAAIRANSVEVVRWLFERFPAYGVRRAVVYEAASAGALEILQFFRSNAATIHDEEEEAEEGFEWNEEKEDWERGRWVRWGGLDAERAVLAGQTHVVRWMYKTDELEDRNDYATMDAALATGNMDLLRWVMHLTKISPEGHEGLYGAAARGLVGPLQFLQDRGEYKKFDAGTLIKAAEAGHMNVVHWIMNRDRNDEGLGDESGEDEYRTFERRPEDRKTHLTCLEGEASLAIHAAAINGHLNIAKYLYALINMPRDRGDRIKENQRLKNRGALLRFVSGSAQKVSGKTMIRAAEKGFFDVVEWLYDEFNGDPTINLFWVDGYFDEEFGYNESEVGYDEQVFCSVVDAAAANGHLDVVQFLLQVAAEERTSKRRRVASYSCPQSEEVPDIPTKPGCTVAAINGAAAHGHLDVVRWLHANRTEGCTTTAMDLAAQNGHLEMVQWLHNNRSEGCTTSAMDMAARGGHLDVIKWLHGHRSEGCTTKAMDNAAATGQLEVVKWLHEHRSEGCTAAAMDGAAAYGELDVVKWLHRHRSAGCTERAMDNAAHGGHLPVLRWLHDNRSDGFTTNAMDNAARFGNFETVLILHNLAQEGLGRDIEILDEDGSEQWVLSKYQEAIASQLPLEQSDARWESTMDVSLYHQRI